jgi:dipeptidase
MDRIGLDLLEEERADRRLPLIRNISTHMAGRALAGLRSDDPATIHLRENRNLMTSNKASAKEERMKHGRFVMSLLCIITVMGVGQAVLGGQECGSCMTGEVGLDKCTVVMVGKEASIDGSVISTHTDDCGVCDWTFRRVLPADHEPGSKRKIYWFQQFATTPPSQGRNWDVLEDNFNGLEIDQVPHTYGFIHGMFGYMNDNQVAIGESTIGCQKRLRNDTPSAMMDITMLTLLAMERASTAREAIQIMGDLAVEYGYGHTDTGEMLAVSDPNEVWIFEIMPVGPLWVPDSGMPGAVWCAERVPDDHVSVCPNESRIGEIDLENKDFFMASENVTSLAEEMGFWDPKGKEPFSWKRAYSPTEGSALSSNGSRGRLWRFFDLVAPSKGFTPDTPNMDLPFSIKPDKKMGVADVFAVLRDRFEGTPFDPARGLQGGPFGNPNHLPYGFEVDGEKYDTSRPIGMNRSEYTVVTQVRDWLPDPIGGIIWIGLGALDTDCFMPFYNGVHNIPESFKFGDHWVFDRRSARWAFDYVDFHTQVMYSYARQDVQKAQDMYEKTVVQEIPYIDQRAKELFETSPEEASAYLTRFSNDNAGVVVKAWWELGDNLLVKYNKLWIYEADERKRNSPEYPEWFLRELAKQNGLKPQTN